MNPDHLVIRSLARSLARCVHLLVHSAVFLSAAAEILWQKEVRSEQPVAFHLPVISDSDVTSASTNNEIFASSPAAGISSFFSSACFHFFQAPLLQLRFLRAHLQCRMGTTRRSYTLYYVHYVVTLWKRRLWDKLLLGTDVRMEERKERCWMNGGKLKRKRRSVSGS